MKLIYIEIEADESELKSSNTLSDNLFATLNNALYKARFATAMPCTDEEEPEEDSNG